MWRHRLWFWLNLVQADFKVKFLFVLTNLINFHPCFIEKTIVITGWLECKVNWSCCSTKYLVLEYMFPVILKSLHTSKPFRKFSFKIMFKKTRCVNIRDTMQFQLIYSDLATTWVSQKWRKKESINKHRQYCYLVQSENTMILFQLLKYMIKRIIHGISVWYWVLGLIRHMIQIMPCIIPYVLYVVYIVMVLL